MDTSFESWQHTEYESAIEIKIDQTKFEICQFSVNLVQKAMYFTVQNEETMEKRRNKGPDNGAPEAY